MQEIAKHNYFGLITVFCNIGNPNEAAESQHLVSWRKPVSNFIANTWKNTILSTKNRVLHSYKMELPKELRKFNFKTLKIRLKYESLINFCKVVVVELKNKNLICSCVKLLFV